VSPMAPMRICAHPGCWQAIPGDAKRGRCEKHRLEDQRAYDRTRPAWLVKFYNSTLWRKTREAVKRESPFCAMHLARGEVAIGGFVDHIQPVRTHPHLKLERSNLQNLCLSCHRSKTRREESQNGGRQR
jgi:5-methylcytosine-specific restriction protein A